MSIYPFFEIHLQLSSIALAPEFLSLRGHQFRLPRVRNESHPEALHAAKIEDTLTFSCVLSNESPIPGAVSTSAAVTSTSVYVLGRPVPSETIETSPLSSLRQNQMGAVSSRLTLSQPHCPAGRLGHADNLQQVDTPEAFVAPEPYSVGLSQGFVLGNEVLAPSTVVLCEAETEPQRPGILGSLRNEAAEASDSRFFLSLSGDEKQLNHELNTLLCMYLSSIFKTKIWELFNLIFAL
ncbi:unnamed protein product [Protopolystoma xenopodis]|uniref:Uncharacterized protein n=1 Tax=Protopolystoma xenopodis TaxID=117903 RepID=A0A3S5C392_9PLAT|nr:unnamed protein product [Protopolystoma xenopodis]